MWYLVTVQLGGRLVCSNCFCASRTIICEAPISLINLSEKGELLSCIKGIMDETAMFCITNECRS
jgi:hypothetical protein